MIVLDTSVVSLVFKGERSGFYLPHMAGQRTLVSFQTVEEMWYGAYKAGWGARQKNKLALHLEQYEVVMAGRGNGGYFRQFASRTREGWT